ncbi:hypothetical protein K1719_038609 [Acacia pycnantha]|nr:hypothetical protein K1719_038609 [Acacia pycnantha]
MKGDKYINADVAEVASKIDALEEQSSQGSFTPATRMDILSMAIGKPDYLDAVRGETQGVSVAKYFGWRSRCSHDDDNPSPQLVAKIRANLVDEILAQVREAEEFLKKYHTFVIGLFDKFEVYVFSDTDDFKSLLEPLQDVARTFKSKIHRAKVRASGENQEETLRFELGA